jgi:uncharacterized protein YlzI (FlbEa/FlbD family)
MIKFTDPQGNHVYIAPEHISGIYEEDEDAVNIAIVGESSVYTVMGSAEEVAKKIVRYKFIQMQMNAHYIAISKKESYLDTKANVINYENEILGEE